MSLPTTKRRSRMRMDTQTMRRVRRRYIRRLRPWLEQDRERIYQLCARMGELGLYASTTAAADYLSGIINTMAILDMHDTPDLKRVWRMKTGWSAYWGYMGTKAYRAKQRKTA